MLELMARLVTRDSSFSRFGQRVASGIETGDTAFDACLVEDPELFWRLLPDRSLPREPGRHFFGLISNHDGLRGPDVGERRDGVTGILVLGDSCAFGFGLQASEAWPALLEERLHAAGLAAEVLNAGVPGYASSQGVVLARRLLPRHRPHVVLAAFGWNDSSIWDGLTDAHYLAASSQRATDAAALLEHSRAFVLIRKLALTLRRALRGREALQPRVPPAEFSANLAAIADECRRAGAGLLLVAWPFRDQVADPSRPATEYQQRTLHGGVPAIDLLAAFREHGSAASFLDTGHATAAGAGLAADTIAQALLSARR